MSEKLKPCPLCDSAPYFHVDDMCGNSVRCRTCYLQLHGNAGSRAALTDRWNTRPDPVVSDEAVERARIAHMERQHLQNCGQPPYHLGGMLSDDRARDRMRAALEAALK